ncbi:hybrid sensor histidine kinase/response regulator [Maribellus mangrovi]|uniref:hybrid sensor histidine kinase/response regulator n=1 Tax=Maribellus mangrovi TaxID=3133146 RepID=UPI0030EBB5A5
MKRIKIEIPIILLTIVMLALMALSGNLVYKSLSKIVNSMENESTPDNKLLLVKDVNSELNELENIVKLYSLSEEQSYVSEYFEINNSLNSKLTDVKGTAILDSLNQPLLDSIITLSYQKMGIWEKILNLHLSKKNEHEAFDQYFETLDTVMIVQDTFYYEEPEKEGVFKRIFGKNHEPSKPVDTTLVNQDTTQIEEAKKVPFFKRIFKGKSEPPKPIIVDRTVEKQILRQEMQDLEQEIRERNKEISSIETDYLQENLKLNEALSKTIKHLESNEQESLLKKSEDADILANQTYQRLATFALSLILLMILVLFLFFRDLRKSRAYQKALQAAKTQAENLARTKELFVATVSHEMRTPVNAIHGLSEQLIQQKHNTKTQKDLQVIYESTQHLTELVNDTFDFTRIENQRLQLKPDDFSLNDLIDKLEMYYHESSSAKNIHFEVEKNFEGTLVLFGDDGRLKQILNNLLTNAIKFTDDGRVKLKAEANEQDDKVWLSFEISDTGIGIAKESQQRIFDDFVQLESDINKKAGGTGLGLYIVKKLVDLLDGEINLESQPGKGTTIFVKLPFEKGDQTKLLKNVKSKPTPPTLRNKKVLIVDDDEFNRHLLKTIFGKWKIDFDEAENGKEAVDLSERNIYALILMDIRMPVMNGIEATQKIKASGNGAKIIALSANTGNEIASTSDAGFDGNMEKPFTEAALYNLIETILEGQPKPEEAQQEKGSTAPDLNELERMANGDPKFMQEMISLFIKTSESSLLAMNDNLEKENFQAIADLAHKLASPVKYMNVIGVYNTLKELEQLAKEGDKPKIIAQKVTQLQSEIETLNDELKVMLKDKF